LEVLFPRCCGLDVHQKTVVACVKTPEGKETRTFKTMTEEILELADWLATKGVTHVDMESTGVFWQPIYNLLEQLNFTLLVVNAHHIKTVPGRKTDMKDAEWVAELLRHGLLNASFIPDRQQRELRELTRYRRNLVQQRSQVIHRIQKVLEGANIKLTSVASNVMGVSGRAMLEALAKGVKDPQVLAELAKGRLRSKRLDLEEALRGLVGSHQQMLLQSQLRHIDFLEAEIARVDHEVVERMTSFEDALNRLDEIPGMGRRSAEEVLAEIGTDMSRFPNAAHLASWAKVCPGSYESAGKRKSGKIGHGNAWLRSALVEVAQAAGHTHNTYLSAQYHRLASRRGNKRAVIALAHTILLIVYSLLRYGSSYHDMGPNYFDERDQHKTLQRSIKRIERLGYQVVLQPV
jgi:transposase